MMNYTLESLFQIKGRSVVIPGGTSGIGFEIACALADLGANVAVVGRNPQKCEKAEQELKRRNPTAMAIQGNVQSSEEIGEAFRQAAEAFGTIDGLVYSAGINHIEELATQPEADFDDVMNTNFKGLVYSCKEAGKYMRAKGFGAIVNISSTSTAWTKPAYTAYSASKAASDGFIRSLACEWVRDGIQVNSVAPGLVFTDINKADYAANPAPFDRIISEFPTGKPATADMMVGIVVALLSPCTKNIVGQTIFCNGGITIGEHFIVKPKGTQEAQQ